MALLAKMAAQVSLVLVGGWAGVLMLRQTRTCRRRRVMGLAPWRRRHPSYGSPRRGAAMTAEMVQLELGVCLVALLMRGL